MHFSRLTDRDDQVRFMTRYGEESGQLPDEPFMRELCDSYLPHGQVHTFMDETSGKMCGGFVVIENARHARWLPRLPSKRVQELEPVIQDGIELNFVWISKEHRKTRNSLKLWSEISRTVGAFRHKKYVTYSASMEKAGLLRLYAAVSKGVLYEGPYAGLEGPYQLFWSSPSKFRWIPWLYGPTYFINSFRGPR